MRNECRLLVAACAILLVSVVPGTMSAASRLTDDLSELTKNAPVVIEVEVLRIEAGDLPIPEELPYSNICVRVNAVFKGDVKDGQELRVQVLGGEAAGQRTVVPGQPRLENGQRAVLLLIPSPQEGIWRVIGGDIGQIQLGKNGNGELVAWRASGGNFDYYVEDPASLTGFSAVHAPAMNADVLRSLMQALATDGRPVLKRAAVQQPAPALPLAALGVQEIQTIATPDAIVAARLLLAIGVIGTLWLLLRRYRREACR